jgi:hypothetical protein
MYLIKKQCTVGKVYPSSILPKKNDAKNQSLNPGTLEFLNFCFFESLNF